MKSKTLKNCQKQNCPHATALWAGTANTNCVCMNHLDLKKKHGKKLKDKKSK